MAHGVEVVAGTRERMWVLFGSTQTMAFEAIAALRSGTLDAAALAERANTLGGIIEYQPRGIEPDPHVGQGVCHRLVLDDRNSELLTLLGVLERVLVESSTVGAVGV